MWFIYLPAFLLPLLLLAGPVVAWNMKRARWLWLDLVALVLPGLLWLLLIDLDRRGRSLHNLIELPLLAASLALLALIRSRLTPRVPRFAAAILLLASGIAVALALVSWFPPLSG